MSKKHTTPEGMLEIQGTVKAVLKTLVPVDATMEQKIDALFAAYQTKPRELSEITVKYTSKAGLDALRAAQAQGIGVPKHSEPQLITIDPGTLCTPVVPDDSPAINTEADEDTTKGGGEGGSEVKRPELKEKDKKLLADTKVTELNPHDNDGAHDAAHAALKATAAKPAAKKEPVKAVAKKTTTKPTTKKEPAKAVAKKTATKPAPKKTATKAEPVAEAH